MKRLTIVFFLLFFTFALFGQLKVTTGNVNFRTTPELKDNKICIIPKGNLVTIVQGSIEYEYWIKVSFNGQTGYVSKEYIDDISSDSKVYNYNKSLNTEKEYYNNSKGEKVQSPTNYKSPPIGATAECYDGTYSFSKSRRGTCSHHGGVKRWL